MIYYLIIGEIYLLEKQGAADLPGLEEPSAQAGRWERPAVHELRTRQGSVTSTQPGWWKGLPQPSHRKSKTMRQKLVDSNDAEMAFVL